MATRKTEEATTATEKGKEDKKKTRRLAVPLTDAELVVKATDMSKTLNEIDHLEAQKKAFTDEMKAKIEVAEQHARSLGRTIQAKQEFRDVDIKIKRDERRAEIVVSRMDTGEIIEQRPMTEAERQEKLPLNGAAKKKDAEAAASP